MHTISAQCRNVARKSWLILNAIAAGLSAFLILEAGAFFLGVIASWILVKTEWIHLGEYSSLLGIELVYRAFYPAMIAGVIVCWMVARSLLRKLATNDPKP